MTEEFKEGRVRFTEKFSDKIQEGDLLKDPMFWGGYKVVVPFANHSIKTVIILEYIEDEK
jgi:hypothetical protein